MVRISSPLAFTLQQQYPTNRRIDAQMRSLIVSHYGKNSRTRRGAFPQRPPRGHTDIRAHLKRSRVRKLGLGHRRLEKANSNERMNRKCATSSKRQKT